MQINLKPCPFCGGTKPFLAEGHEDYLTVRVMCFDCDASTLDYESSINARRDWNRRTLPSNAEGILRDLESGSISVGDALELLEASK